jgi:hypothetical protein
MAQKGVSGNKDFGCDAIIVSGARKDEGGLCQDEFSTLEYWAETRVGGGAILKSMANKNPIRVFRSSVLPNPYRAVEENPKYSVSPSAIYRYDGLYQVTEVSFVLPGGIKVSEVPGKSSPVVSHRLYYFQLVRLEAGTGALFNLTSDQTCIDNCRAQGTMLHQ